MSVNNQKLSRRSFLQISTVLGAASLGGLAVTLQNRVVAQAALIPAATAMATSQATAAPTGPFSLLPLPYAYDALEPSIDKMTMQLHHDKHHATYVTNLNTALAKFPDLQTKSIEDLLHDLNNLPDDVRTTVRNQGGGHVNHTAFWTFMAPHAGGVPTGELADALKSTFNDFATFKDQFTKAALGRFGSGWAWLVRDSSGALKITSTANQDSPLIDDQDPLLGIDVWEHAYYLKYQNRRADYIAAWWNVVNWKEVADRFVKTKM